MTEAEMKARTKGFSVDVLEFARTLPNEPICREIMRQLIRSGMSQSTIRDSRLQRIELLLGRHHVRLESRRNLRLEILELGALCRG